MPVADAPLDDVVGRYRRLSHTQADTHRRCPRMWYYRYVKGLLGGAHPIFGMGHAVEGALNRVMRDSPVLIPADAPSESFDSPIDEIDLDGSGNLVSRPSIRKDAEWPGPLSEQLPEMFWPKDRIQIQQWAEKRADLHFDREWELARIGWEEDPNRVGDWNAFEEANKSRAREMVNAGIKFHLEEVSDCIQQFGGPHFHNWRLGKQTEQWPAPNGFPYDYQESHPSAKREGEITWCEAWEVARPWFVDPDAGLFSLAAVHPEGWLQGEYDLVYRWTGEIRIFDVKASQGISDFSSGYPEQLANYSYLWWVTHERKELVNGLEIWYLGVPLRKKVPLPNEASLKRLEARLKPLHQRLKLADEHPILSFPATPKPIRIFAEGGVDTGKIESNELARCDTCEYKLVCEAPDLSEELPNGGDWLFSSASDAKVNCTSIGEIDPFVTVRGRVREPNMVKQWPTYEKEFLEFYLDMEPGEWLAVVIRQEKPEIPYGFEHGATIRITNGIIASGWNPTLGNHRRLDVGGAGAIELSTSPSEDETPGSELSETLYNVRAKLFNFDHREEKWGAKLVDSTGSIGFQCWGGKAKYRQVLEAFEPERGEEVIITGAQAKDQFGKIILNCKVNKTFQTRLRPIPDQ